MRLLFSTLCMACMAGCISPAYDTTLNMQQYVGLPATQLVKQLGSPEISYTDEQQTTLTYSPIVNEISTITETRVPAAGHGTPWFLGFNFVNIPVKSPKLNRKVYADCQVHFSVKRDIVQSWVAQGAECPASLLQH